MINGNHFKTLLQHSGDIPVVKKSNFKFSEDNKSNNGKRRQGELCSFIHLMCAISLAYASLHATSLMCVENSTHHFSF